MVAASDSLAVPGDFATTCTIPENILTVGSAIEFAAAGTITGGAYNTYWSFPVKLGAAAVLPMAPVGYNVPGSNTFLWEVRGTIVVTSIGANGTVFGTAQMDQGNGTSFGAPQGQFFAMQTPGTGVTLDTTVNQAFTIDFAPSANPSSQTASLKMLWVRVLQ